MGKKRWLTGLVATASLVGMAGLTAVPASAEDMPWSRVSGPTAIQTSGEVARSAYPSGANVVYVASSLNPVDALPAASIGDGPVVLTDGKTIDLGQKVPQTAIIVGGTGAVPASVETLLRSKGVQNVQRLWGQTRNQTALEIAKRWVQVNGAPKMVYVTRNAGTGSPDAVAASISRQGPILTFWDAASMDAVKSTIKSLGVAKATILGGTGVVSAEEQSAVESTGVQVDRLAGANRYETSFRIAQSIRAAQGGTKVYLAAGTALKDAMVAGAFSNGVIILVPPNADGVSVQIKQLGGTTVVVIGGKGVMPDARVQAAINGNAPQQPSQPAPNQDGEYPPNNIDPATGLLIPNYGGVRFQLKQERLKHWCKDTVDNEICGKSGITTGIATDHSKQLYESGETVTLDWTTLQLDEGLNKSDFVIQVEAPSWKTQDVWVWDRAFNPQGSDVKVLSFKNKVTDPKTGKVAWTPRLYFSTLR